MAAALLSDADVGLGQAPPKGLLSDAEVGLKPQSQPADNSAPEPYSALPIFPGPKPGAVGRIIEAGREGYENTPPLVTSETGEAIDKWSPGGLDVGKNLVNPALKVGGAAIGAVGGAIKGGQQFLQEAISPISPGLGRDVAAFPEAFPTGLPGVEGGPHGGDERASRIAQEQQAFEEMKARAEQARGPVTLDKLVTSIVNADTVEGAISEAEKAASAPAAVTPAEAEIPTITVRPTPEPEAAGAGVASRDTSASPAAMPADEFAANRLQGEVERLATPPKPGDTNEYIPGVKLTIAEVDPTEAMRQAYNRQQPEATPHHTAVENKNAELVANYYADTAGSAQTLLRMNKDRDARAAQNIQAVFGDPQDTRPPADPSPTVDMLQKMLDDPRQAERDAVIKTITNLASRLYNADGTLKTDPYALYGIGEHINDLLRGVGDTETSSAARVLQRELIQVRESLYDDIERDAPGFAQYRADYRADSQAIDAMKMLQDERLGLLNKDLHITPAKWFSFMRDIVTNRDDPMSQASALSEAQMDRLWNITDYLKRTTFLEAGKPRGSWTSLMQEMGGRIAEAAGHLAALHFAPVIGNVGISLAKSAYRSRSVRSEMERVLNPDLSKYAPPVDTTPSNPDLPFTTHDLINERPNFVAPLGGR